ncbi:MAG: lysyl oxidase family protein [Actinomycetota bacterium]|nr:lysyl oxidase family protein [Actinomycetota bacterium]
MRSIPTPPAAAVPVIALALAVSLCTPSGAVAFAPNPCLDTVKRRTLNCPDLVMKRPSGLALDYTARPGRVVLRAGNSIDNVGRGPAELHGTRLGRYFMKGRQRIYRRAGGRLGINTGARLFFKFVARQGRYWKFHRAAAFGLWRIDSDGRRTRLVKRGPKVSYCLRDLERSRPGLARSPASRVYPACSTDQDERRVTLGTSAGWSDVYPPTYPEQWIDVTGLRGCFAYRHVADPRNGIYEADERNNSATTVVRLPFRAGRQSCPGGRVEGRARRRTDPYRY